MYFFLYRGMYGFSRVVIICLNLCWVRGVGGVRGGCFLFRMGIREGISGGKVMYYWNVSGGACRFLFHQVFSRYWTVGYLAVESCIWFIF